MLPNIKKPFHKKHRDTLIEQSVILIEQSLYNTRGHWDGCCELDYSIGAI